jgi:hypothetical protein
MGIRYELATNDNRSMSTMQFKEYYQDKNTSPAMLSDLLIRVFTQALFPLYRDQKIVERKYRKFYFLPRYERGEYTIIDDVAKHSRFYNTESGMLELSGTTQPLHNPGLSLRPNPSDNNCPFYRLFESNRLIGLSQAHGDLNPRNLLIDRDGQFHIIDFSEMKDAEKGTRFLDLVRLESETKIKLTDLESKGIASRLAIEELLVESTTLVELERLGLFPMTPEALKMIAVVYALRKSARVLADENTMERQVDFEYKLGLLAQTLRLALFSDYITEIQQEYAVIAAALLAEHLLKICSNQS